MQQVNILYEQSAIKIVLKQLKELISYSWNNVTLTNRNRYAIINGEPNIAILLKTEPFFNFGQAFYQLGEKGVGDSINCDALKEFIQKDVKFIYTIFRDGKIYCISLEDFLKYSHKWQNKEGKLLRSINIHHYKRVNLDKHDLREPSSYKS